MNKKSPIEMERDRIIKITRALVRLKHSLKADEELNEILPETLDEFDKATQKGELKTIAPEVTLLLEELSGASTQK